MYQWIDRQSDAEDYYLLSRLVVLFGFAAIVGVVIFVYIQMQKTSVDSYQLFITIGAVLFMLFCTIVIYYRSKKWKHKDIQRARLAFDKNTLYFLSQSTPIFQLPIQDINQIEIRPNYCRIKHTNGVKRVYVYDMEGFDKSMAPHFEKKTKRHWTIYKKHGFVDKEHEKWKRIELLFVLILFPIAVFAVLVNSFYLLLIIPLMLIAMIILLIRRNLK